MAQDLRDLTNMQYKLTNFCLFLAIFFEQQTMKHSLFLCVVLIAALGPAVEAFFLGPVAVGVGLGALAVTKGLILGSILGGSRTQERGGRSYTRYSRTNHYNQNNKYYSHYTQQKTVSGALNRKCQKYLTFPVLVLLLLKKIQQLQRQERYPRLQRGGGEQDGEGGEGLHPD